jgi:hypothetical protein
MKVIVSEGSGRAQPLQALEEVAAPGSLGWAEGRGGGRDLGDTDERGESKKKQRGAGRESQGPRSGRRCCVPPPLQPAPYLELFENRKSQGVIKPSSRRDVWR